MSRKRSLIYFVCLILLLSVIVIVPVPMMADPPGYDPYDDDGGGGGGGGGVCPPGGCDGGESTNFRPIATIDAISPNPGQEFETISFSGHGNDSDGTITDFWWEIDTQLVSNMSSFSLDTLSPGVHVIELWVMDDKEKWSHPANVSLEVNVNVPPDAPSITGDPKGSVKDPYTVEVKTVDPNGNQVLYMVDWGDVSVPDWSGPYESDQIVALDHLYEKQGEYIVQVKAKDVHGSESDWVTLTVTMPYSYNNSMHQFLELLFQQFPHAFPLLRQLMGY